MYKILTIVILVCICCDILGQNAKLSINIKSRELVGDSTILIFSRSDMGDTGYGFKKIPARLGLSYVNIKCSEPFFCNIELRRGDSVLKASNSFLITQSNIKVEFNINRKFPLVTGGENDYYFQNRFLLFEMPAIIARHPDFSCNRLKERYEFQTKNILLQYYVNEYENNIINTVSSKKNYFVVLQTLWNKVECVSLKTLEICYNKFTDSLRRTSIGKMMGDYITNSKKIFPGKQAPSFSVVNPDGKNIESDKILSSNKHVFIDFWASWCLPCRAQMRDLREVYQISDTSKFKLVSISIDSEEQKWLKASLEEKIAWPHFLAFGGWQGDVATKFALTYIPQNVIIDPSGIIVASNLTISQLRMFLAENKILKVQ